MTSAARRNIVIVLAALVVSAVEGAIILSRAERDPAPLVDVARELEATIETALD